MKYFFFFACLLGVHVCAADSSEVSIPYSVIEAPVVHSGKYHILSCGETYVVLDGSQGMSLCDVGKGAFSEKGLNRNFSVLNNTRLAVTIRCGDEMTELSQVYDPSAHLQIISGMKKVCR